MNYLINLYSFAQAILKLVEKEQNNIESLLTRLHQHDRDAFVTIYKLLFKELHLYANRLCTDTNLFAEDIVQDVFVSLWNRPIPCFESLLKLKAFLYTAIHNQYKSQLDHLKVQKNYEKYIQETAEISTQIIENEMYASLLNTLELLPEKYAQVLRLYLEGYEIKEIATELQLSPQTIYNIKSLAIRLLKEKLLNTTSSRKA